MSTSLIGQAMPVLVPPAKEAILGRNCYLEPALFGASQATIFSKRGSPRNLKRISSNRQSRGLARGCHTPNPRNRLELESRAGSLSTHSCK
jgi:hypothetical protein